MKILFCNIAWMNEYKGITEEDEPQGGGAYVREHADAHEKYNFEAVHRTAESGYPEGDYCLGFVETKSTNGATRNQLNIEKIEGYYDQAYNAIARAEDCVLLPRATRRKANLWKVPRKSKGASYGFGQSNVWFAQGREKNEYLNRFLERVIAQIEAYDGENRL